MLVDISGREHITRLLNEGGKLVIDFYSDWCPPCKKLMPILKDVSVKTKYSNLHFLKVNTDVFPDIAGDYKIPSIPTLMFVKSGGSEIKKYPGFKSQEEIEKIIDEFFV